MTTKRPTAIRPDRRSSLSELDATDPPSGERDHEQAAALWLYAWSYDALRPTGELLAARLTTPAVLRPGSRISRIPPRNRLRSTSPWSA